MSHIPNREETFALLCEYNKEDSHIKHALAVEATMTHFAELWNEPDVIKWGIVGLAHDLDYEFYPNEHCVKVREILTSLQWPEDYIHAIESHGYGLCVDVAPIERMEKLLYTIDELTGLIAATVIMRPSRSILDLEVKSVKKKWKDKRFAAGVDRDVISNGAVLLELDLDFIIDETIQAMKKVAESIGLKGTL